MTPTEQARRSDALYTDYSGKADRRRLCDMLLSLEWTMRGNAIHVRQFMAYKRLARRLGVRE